MSRNRLVRVIAIAGVLSLLAAACNTGGGGGGGVTTGDAKKGGTYRIETDGFEWTNSFDPTGEYLGTAFAFYSNLLLRTVTGYKHLAGDDGGNEVIPDLATDLGQVSADGTEYTFTLKKGAKWAPPLSRDVIASDVVYAFERIGTKSLAAQYGFYYEPIIEGLVEFKNGDAKTISGVTAVDDYTVRFKLKKPAGDFRYLLAMPAAAPVPPEVGKCFDKAGEYGRFLMASGPYMIEGSDKLPVAGGCRRIRGAALSGFDPTSHLRIVRNPNYDEATDTKEARENFPDRFTLELNTNTDDIFNKIKAGTVDAEVAAPPSQVLQEYSTTPTLKDRLQSFSGDRTWYITLNLTEPPFDDLAVRKATNWVMNKAGLLRVWGGPIRGEIADHIIPPDVLGGKLPKGEFSPYQTPNDEGDVEKAKAEMRESKYDTNQDGICDASACKNVLHITRNTPPQRDMAPVIEESLEKIGITLRTRESENSYPIIQEPARKVPIASNAGWGKDYPDASTFAVLFDSRSILKNGNTNYSLVGLTRDKANEINSDFVDGIPSVDGDIDVCATKTDEERLNCWAELDKKLMNDVVPWVPYLWATNIDIIGSAVTKYVYDQFSGEAAFAHVAVDPAKQV